MTELKQWCERELKRLEMLRKRSEELLNHAPKGVLRVSACKNINQYYWRNDEEDGKLEYIKKSESGLIEELAQKDYAMRILKIVNCKEKNLHSFMQMYMKEDFESVYDNLCEGRKKWVKPFCLSEKDFISAWEKRQEEKMKNSTIQGKYALTDELSVLTERRELVRSKTEKIIADKLYMMGVPYVYEVPLWLQEKGSFLYPDFTVLNVAKRKEMYWEHFGMMDKEEYCTKALRKIEDYAKAGIYPGEKLIVTYETSKYLLNIDMIEGMVKEYLK